MELLVPFPDQDSYAFRFGMQAVVFSHRLADFMIATVKSVIQSGNNILA